MEEMWLFLAVHVITLATLNSARAAGAPINFEAASFITSSGSSGLGLAVFSKYARPSWIQRSSYRRPFVLGMGGTGPKLRGSRVCF